MKIFKIDGEEIGTPSPKSWERRYLELKLEYDRLKKKYDKLALDESWRTNPDRMGK
jgi:hypothetical protein